MTWIETVAVVRDIAIVALALVTTLAVVVVCAKITALVDSTKRIVKGVEDVTSSIAGAVGPVGAGAGFFAGIARAAAPFIKSSERDEPED